MVVWDDDAMARGRAEEAGFSLRRLNAEEAFKGIDKLIVSPGIPVLYPIPHPAVALAAKMGIPLDNDIGLFFQAMANSRRGGGPDAPVIVAITGSNGKSTTAALLRHVLKATGRHSQIAGNFGNGVLASDPPRPGEVIVLELSSYQTELASELEPDIAVMLNLSPDHLDRHGGLGGYFAAKRRLFASDRIRTAVIGIDDPEGRFLASEYSARKGRASVVRISGSEIDAESESWSICASNGRFREYRGGQVLEYQEFDAPSGLPGAHNLFNACAVLAACKQLGIRARQAIAAMESFQGLRHRMQFIGMRRGVSYVNDSKATNVASAARSLQAFDSIRWIAGGRAKEGGLSSLGRSASKVVKAYYIGEAAEDFARQISDVPFEICGDMAAAVSAAARDSRAGDTVLLAPAAASFDQFSNFEERGDEFAAEVKLLIS